MPVTHLPSAPRWGRVLVTATLVPALLLPASAATAAPPGAATTPTADSSPAVPEAHVSEVPLSGIDPAVIAAAPEPETQPAGSMSAMSAEPEVAVALAETVDIAEPATLVAVTADADFADGTTVQVRVKEAQYGWSEWMLLHTDPEHGPDPDSEEAQQARPGSEPLLAVDALKAQIRVDTPSGVLPRGTALTLVDAPTAAADRAIEPEAVPTGSVSAPSPSSPSMTAQSMTAQSLAAASSTGRPSIITRAQWGADESWRGRAPYYTDDIKAGFIHHTASTSNYTQSQAASQVRAIYRYHTLSLGHSDIDYNFLVDRFGRLYEGRYGGMDRPVLGGHTAGFNEHTFAAVALGNFDSGTVPWSQMEAIKDSLARLFAWKLGLYGLSPASTVQLVSAGFIRPTRYPKGSVATLTATSTHRTVNYTSCPGRYLQAQVPAITALGAKYSPVVISAPRPSARSFVLGSQSSVSFSSSSTRAVRWTAEVLSSCSETPVRTYHGRTSGDEGISFDWNLRDSDGRRVLPATYTVRMSGTDSSGSPVAVVSSAVTISPKPGGQWGPCENVKRISGGNAAEASVLWGRVSAPDSRVVVLTRGASRSQNALAAGVAAAPLAKSLGAPLLMTPAESLSSAVAADIRARSATEVIIVGGDRVIDPDVAAAVAQLGVKVTRLTGGSQVRTAAVVAERMNSRSAVLVSVKATPAHSLAGAALAAARGVPVLLGTSGALPARTADALSGKTSVIVAAPASVLSDADVTAAVGGATWKRLTGTDAVGAALAVAQDFPGTQDATTLVPQEYDYWSRAPLAAAAGVPLLFTSSSTLTTRVADYFEEHTAISSASTPIMPAWLDEQVLGAASRAIHGAVPQADGPLPTDTFRLVRTNASPEPVARGAQLKVKARIRTLFTDGVWRRAPRGMFFKVQHKPRGKRHHKAVATGYSLRGRAVLFVTAQTTGTWRIKVGDKRARRDFVRVIE